MAFTLHFICKDFRVFNCTLTVKSTIGKHNAEMLMDYMENVINEWHLSKNKNVIMLRDSGSNMVKACEDWGACHFPCIGHSLHLVVGPFLLEQKNNKNKSAITKVREQISIDEEDTMDDENSDDVRDDAYCDEFTKSYNDDDALKKVRAIVSKIREILRYIKKSTKCKEILEKYQVKDLNERVLRVSLDVCTRRNSTLKMLFRALELKEPIANFLTF